MVVAVDEILFVPLFLGWWLGVGCYVLPLFESESQVGWRRFRLKKMND